MLFSKLIQENSKVWDQYLHHPFVIQLREQKLKKESFLFYLKQDYLYLINYARCFAQLAINATTIQELRFAQKQQNAILDAEISLHQELLEYTNLIENEESLTNIAYSRYMLDIGNQGDYLDLLIALSACSIGYAYIGKEIGSQLSLQELQNHCYKDWIETYACEQTQQQAKIFEDLINSYEVSEKKFARLSQIFKTVTRLEVAFWQHSLELRMD